MPPMHLIQRQRRATTLGRVFYRTLGSSMHDTSTGFKHSTFVEIPEPRGGKVTAINEQRQTYSTL